MNNVLSEILRTGLIDNGDERVPLAYNMSEEEGGLIDRAFREARPDVSIEVGLG